MPPDKPVDGLTYDSKGRVYSPQPDHTVWYYLAWLAAAGLPFWLSALRKVHLAYTGVVLPNTSLFMVLVSERRFSSSQVGITELILFTSILFQLAGAHAFFCDFTSRFSFNEPPSIELRDVWRRQLRNGFKLSLAFLALPFGVGMIVRWGTGLEDFFTTKMIFFALFTLGMGLFLFVQYTISSSLYAYLYFQYWRQDLYPR